MFFANHMGPNLLDMVQYTTRGEIDASPKLNNCLPLMNGPTPISAGIISTGGDYMRHVHAQTVPLVLVPEAFKWAINWVRGMTMQAAR